MYELNTAPALSVPSDEACEFAVLSSFESLEHAVDRELEAAIEYKLAVSGLAGVADVLELLDRIVRRRYTGAAAL